jgi:hypothetical protein
MKTEAKLLFVPKAKRRQMPCLLAYPPAEPSKCPLLKLRGVLILVRSGISMALSG